MKANVLMYIGLVLIVLQVSILGNLTAKSCYSDSIKQSLDEALERTMHLTRMDADNQFQMAVGSDYDDALGEGTVNLSGGSLDTFKTQFVNTFASELDPKINKLEVNIFGADAETGILSVEAIADFTYLGGQTGQVSTYKTMIINKTVNDAVEYKRD